MTRRLRWIVPLCAASTAACSGQDILDLPGLRADRAAREVRVTARATGIDPMIPTEFFLIARNSGHDYEAVAVAEALPSDIHRALEFIGMNAGQPASRRALRFWPRGERVIAEIEWKDDDLSDAPPLRIRMERTILDLRTGQPLPETGFVFVGSVRVPAETGEGMVYAADEFSPNSIISAFNLESTVMDVPRRGGQQALYDYQMSNPETLWDKGARLMVVLRPEPRPDGRPRTVDYDLVVAPAPDRSPPLAFTLRERDGRDCVVGGTMEAVAREIARAESEARDAHLTVRVDAAVPVESLAAVDRGVALLVERHGTRIEPPPAGQLFPQAFSPDEDLRIRKGRPAQPWELHFIRAPDGRSLARLVKLENTRDAITDVRIVRATEFDAGSPAELRAALDRHGPGMPVVVCFAPEGFPFGEIMRYLTPILPTHPIVHLFAVAE